MARTTRFSREAGIKVIGAMQSLPPASPLSCSVRLGGSLLEHVQAQERLRPRAERATSCGVPPWRRTPARPVSAVTVTAACPNLTKE